MPSPPAAPPPSAPAAGGRPALRALAGHPAVHAALLVGAAALVYANTLGAPFVMDDWSSIVASATTRDLAAWASAWHWAWNRALVDLTFALNRELGGLDPAGFHLVNAALHAAAGLLVWRLAAALLGGGPAARGPALAAGLVFAVHPVQTGAVTYVAQRYTVLATLLYVAAAVLYLGWRRGAGRAAYAGALLCAVLAMRSKEIAFTLPFVLLAAELAFHDGPLRARLLPLLPFAATLALIPASLLAAGETLASASGVDPFASRTLGTVPLSRLEYLLTQLRVIPTYLRLLVLPVDLTFDYDFPPERTLSPAVAASLLLLLALAAAGAALLLRGRRAPRGRVAGFGVLWFFVALSVESSVVPIDDVAVEHRVYLPSVGFALVVAAALAAGADALRARSVAGARALAAAAAAALVALGVAAHLRNEVWSDAIGFWSDAVEKAPRKARPRVNLGVALAEAGRVDEAIGVYESVLYLSPDDPLARYNLANLYVSIGLVEPAVQHLEALLRRTPGSPATRTTLANLYLRQGRRDRAEAELLAALRGNPSYGPALEALARLRREQAAR